MLDLMHNITTRVAATSANIREHLPYNSPYDASTVKSSSWRALPGHHHLVVLARTRQQGAANHARQGKVANTAQQMHDVPSSRKTATRTARMAFIDEASASHLQRGGIHDPMAIESAKQRHLDDAIGSQVEDEPSRSFHVFAASVNREEGRREESMEVIGVGIAAIDVIQEVEAFPREDAKVGGAEHASCHLDAESRCGALLRLARCRSGSAEVATARTLSWIGVSTDPENDPDAALAFKDLASFKVDCSLVNTSMKGSFPVSYILSSKQTGSRTIVHYRGIPDMSFEVFDAALSQYLATRASTDQHPVWFHFEGRNMDVVLEMMRLVHATVQNATVSVEIEALRYEWRVAKKLMAAANYVFVSKDYIKEKLCLQTAQQFFDGVHDGRWEEDWSVYVQAFICPWGADGVYYLDMSTASTHHVEAERLNHIVESVGAGDSFIGAAIAGLCSNMKPSLEQSIRFACQVATNKCAQQGFKLPPKVREEYTRALESTETINKHNSVTA